MEPNHDHPIDARTLRESHQRLEAAFNDLSERAGSGDWREVDEIWDWFSRDLELHMRIEEEQIFPGYRASSVEAAMAVDWLRREHEVIRAQLLQVGVDIQLHTVRAESVQRFVAALEDHARREDETLHVWMETREAAARLAGEMTAERA